MATYEINTDILSTAEGDELIRRLRIGDSVYLTGKAFTCRSRLHRWVFDEEHPLPQTVRDRRLLIHVGPIVVKEDGQWRLVSFMPNSSIRFEKWGARSVREWGLKVIVGKTTMGKETAEAMAECGCVHLSPRSVSPNLWVEHIKIEDVDLFDELGTIEATWRLNVDRLGPFVVDIDTTGSKLFDALDQIIEQNRRAAFEKIGIPDGFEYTKLY